MLENSDRTIGPKFSHLDANLLHILKKRFDLFRLLLASRGSSAAREADEIMMQIKRKLEMIWQRVSDRILFLSNSACLYFTGEFNVVQRISLYCINSMAMSPRL